MEISLDAMHLFRLANNSLALQGHAKSLTFPDAAETGNARPMRI
jgi:hypothetical protein